MAVNVPLVHISDLAEATTASDTGDYLVIGAADAKKIKWGTIFNLIKTKLGLSAVATTGSYNDLSNKPSIPSSLASFGVTASAANLNQTAGATGNLQTQINSLNTKMTGMVTYMHIQMAGIGVSSQGYTPSSITSAQWAVVAHEIIYNNEGYVTGLGLTKDITITFNGNTITAIPRIDVAANKVVRITLLKIAG